MTDLYMEFILIQWAGPGM